MKSNTIKAIIVYTDDYKLSYQLFKIEETIYEDGSYKYIVSPNYSIYALIDHSLFSNILGFDLAYQMKDFEMQNTAPYFILNHAKKDKSLIHLEKLLNSSIDEKINIIEYKNKTTIKYEKFIDSKNNTLGNIKSLLNVLCSYDELSIKDKVIGKEERKALYNVLFPLYTRSMTAQKELIESGIKKAKRRNKYKGRKKIEVNNDLLKNIKTQIKNNKISTVDAAKKLNISRSTLYRLLKEKRRIQIKPLNPLNTLLKRESKEEKKQTKDTK